MHVKPITAIVVLLLVVASLSLSGCTTSETTQGPSALASTGPQSFLEKYLTAYQNVTDTNDSISWASFYFNQTSALLQRQVRNSSLNATMSYNETFIEFPTSQNATNYLNAMNTTAYSLADTIYESGGVYQNATGHAPQIYKEYVWVEGDVSNIPEYRLHEIQQLDNLIVITTGKIVR